MLFDSHAHLSCLLSEGSTHEDLDAMIDRASHCEVKHIANICIDSHSLEKGLILAEKYPHIFNVAATTPHDVEKEGSLFFPQVQQAAMQGKLKAIGETGLDYYYEHSNRTIQKEYLEKYLNLAADLNLPVVIHCRDAFEDFFSILDSVMDKRGPIKGVLHCFTGTLEEAKKCLERGFYVSFSGIVTFKRSQVLREVVLQTPLEKMLIETDTPYLAPQKHRGKKNEPAYVGEVAECIAVVKEVPVEKVRKVTCDNARRFFGI